MKVPPNSPNDDAFPKEKKTSKPVRRPSQGEIRAPPNSPNYNFLKKKSPSPLKKKEKSSSSPSSLSSSQTYDSYPTDIEADPTSSLDRKSTKSDDSFYSANPGDVTPPEGTPPEMLKKDPRPYYKLTPSPPNVSPVENTSSSLGPNLSEISRSKSDENKVNSIIDNLDRNLRL